MRVCVTELGPVQHLKKKLLIMSFYMQYLLIERSVMFLNLDKFIQFIIKFCEINLHIQVW